MVSGYLKAWIRGPSYESRLSLPAWMTLGKSLALSRSVGINPQSFTNLSSFVSCPSNTPRSPPPQSLVQAGSFLTYPLCVLQS